MRLKKTVREEASDILISEATINAIAEAVKIGLYNQFKAIDARFEKLDARLEEMDARLEKVDARLEEMDARLEKVDARLEEMDARLEKVDARLEGVDARLEEMDARLEKVDARLEGVDARLVEVDAKFERMDVRFDKLENQIKHGELEGVADLNILLEEIHKTNNSLKRIEEKFDERTEQLLQLFRQKCEISGKVLSFKNNN